MNIKGHTRIELTDTNTGKVEVLEDDNLITNALTDQLAFFTSMYDRTTFNNKFCSLSNNAMGGIKLFDTNIDEYADNYYLPDISKTKVTGYASNDTSDGTDNRRGSRNVLETKELDNGYQFVWDFATSEANGTISSLCLTSADGGRNVWYPYQEIEGDFINTSDVALYVVEIDLEQGYYITVMHSVSAKTVTIQKYEFSYDTLTLSNNIFTPLCTLNEVIQVSTPFTVQMHFKDGGDDFWYAVYTVGNISGSATVYVCSISKETFGFSYQTLSLVDVYATQTGTCNHIVYDGYLYLHKATNSTGIGKGFYKINLSNTADVEEIVFDEWRELTATYTHISPMKNGMLFANGILFNGTDYDVFLADYGNSLSYYSTGSYWYRYGYINYFSTKARQFLINRTTSYQFAYVSPDRNVLMSINNLSSPIIKTADKTMKIIYTLTYEL